MERESQNVTYVVKIQASYNEADFEFKTIEDASKFMSTAALHVVKGDDVVTISMKVKGEGEE